MTEFILKYFVKNDCLKNEKTREKVASVASFIGILCNILLFISKFAVGTMVNSIAIISDSFNNLSDSASNIIMIVGYKLAAMPSDEEHPFGHGRYEYLTSLVISFIVLFVGLELLQSSVEKIFNPSLVIYSHSALIVLILSILVKLWMAVFYKGVGVKINSGALMATSKDSFNDSIATIASGFSLLVSIFSDIPVDGYIGVFVSMFILISGYGILRDTLDEILGKPADADLIGKLTELIKGNEMILDVHDLLIHDYGPGRLIGSAHVEVDASENFLKAHDMVDCLEREIYEEFNILMTLHLDPVETKNEIVNVSKRIVGEVLKSLDENLSFHDFRAVVGPTHTNLVFDIVYPFNCKYSTSEIEQVLLERLKSEEIKYYLVLTFDRSYVSKD